MPDLPARLTINSPLGPLTIEAEGPHVTRLNWGAKSGDPGSDSTPTTQAAARQVMEYFSGTREDFDLPLAPRGSAAQQAVCSAMSAIPFGETTTYGAIAKALNLSAQAVGQLCGGNPIPVIIPCHRVLGATSLGGFSGDGGIESKVWLLRHERAANLLI